MEPRRSNQTGNIPMPDQEDRSNLAQTAEPEGYMGLSFADSLIRGPHNFAFNAVELSTIKN